MFYGFVYAVDCGAHAFHEEGVVNLVQTRAEKSACLLEGGNTALYKQGGDDSVNANRSSKFFNSL
jgi:hypothetical protein